MRIDGSAIRASELSSKGGECVRGPQGAKVMVLGARTHAAENRCLAQVSTSIGVLEVTDDHRIIIQNSDGDVMDIQARAILPPCVLTGQGFQQVQLVELTERKTEVVEVFFADDAPALAWCKSSRKTKNLDLSRAYVVRGSEGRIHDLHPVRNTFFDDYAAHTSSSLRSRSADSVLTSKDQRRLAKKRGKEWAKPC